MRRPRAPDDPDHPGNLKKSIGIKRWSGRKWSGVGAEAFWRQTPAETRLVLTAAGERLAYRRTIWAAWHVAGLARAKKLPPLPKVLRGLDGKPRRMTSDQMLREIEAIALMTGGQDLRKGKPH